MKFATKLLHAGIEPDSATGAIMTPIYQTSTYVQDGVGINKGYEYSRTQNPTRHALEKNLAAIEDAKYGLCFGSGLAAIDAVIKTLNPGDEVISTNDLYGGSYRIFTTIFQKYGINFIFVDMTDISNVKKAITKNTKIIWVETPTNPMMSIIDVEGISKIKGNSWLAVDNTFASPFLQNPLNQGADIIMHSVTKYLGGHSDVVMGALMINNETLAKDLYRIQNSSGAICGPQDCFLVLRGVKTLHLRMERHCSNAEKLAAFLQNHDKVNWVNYAALPDNKYNAMSQRITNGKASGVLSFGIKGGIEAGTQFIDALQMVLRLVNIGDAKSLACHPASTTHRQLNDEELANAGVSRDLVRISVGIENIEDIIADISQALDKVTV